VAASKIKPRTGLRAHVTLRLAMGANMGSFGATAEVFAAQFSGTLILPK
jgi:hypothetical protein